MSYSDIDVFSGKESRAMLKEVRTFAARQMRPAGIELDSLPRPGDVIRKDSLLWEVFRGFRKLDLHLPWISEDLGGMGKVGPRTAVALAECLGHGDAGLAVSLLASNVPFQYASLLKTPELEQLARDYCVDHDCAMVGCVPVAEAAPAPLSGNPDSPGAEPAVSAAYVKGHHVLNGEIGKAVNADIATHAVLTVGIRDKKQEKGRGIAVVPLDLPGVTRTGPQERTGQRSLNQGGLILRDVKLPKGFLVPLEEPALREMEQKFFIRENQAQCAVRAGIAWAALDEALAYSRERIQGGVPIFEHKNIQLQLFNMLKMVEAVRGNTRRLALFHAQAPDACSLVHAVAAKCLASEAAVQVTSEAIQIFGGYGLTKEFPMEKFFRDARSALIENGVNEDLALAAMASV